MTEKRVIELTDSVRATAVELCNELKVSTDRVKTILDAAQTEINAINLAYAAKVKRFWAEAGLIYGFDAEMAWKGDWHVDVSYYPKYGHVFIREMVTPTERADSDRRQQAMVPLSAVLGGMIPTQEE